MVGLSRHRGVDIDAEPDDERWNIGGHFRVERALFPLDALKRRVPRRAGENRSVVKAGRFDLRVAVGDDDDPAPPLFEQVFKPPPPLFGAVQGVTRRDRSWDWRRRIAQPRQARRQMRGRTGAQPDDRGERHRPAGAEARAYERAERAAPAMRTRVRLTHPGKVLYPDAGITKADVAAYIDMAAERMGAHLYGRPVSLVRAPDGIGGQQFFQKHAMKGMPKEIELIAITESDGKPEDYITLPNAVALVSCAQISALEFHLWGARNKDLEHPDRLVLDLETLFAQRVGHAEHQRERVAPGPLELGHVLEVHPVHARDERGHGGDGRPGGDPSHVVVLPDRDECQVGREHVREQLVLGVEATVQAVDRRGEPADPGVRRCVVLRVEEQLHELRAEGHQTAPRLGDLPLESVDPLHRGGPLRVEDALLEALDGLRQGDLHALWSALDEAGLGAANIDTVEDIIACPGLDYCSLANARSIPVAQKISQRFAESGKTAALGELKLKISGCINACGHHHVGHIGILGVDKKGEEFYQLTLGGSGAEDAAVGSMLGPALPANRVAGAIDTLVDVYLRERQDGERFLDTFRRTGVTPFKEAVYADAH